MVQIKKVKQYKNIYFDLDRTLWDFQTNSEKTLKELIDRYAPQLIDDFQRFLNTYYPINSKLWVNYRQGHLKKEVLRVKRFADAFKLLGINDQVMAAEFGDAYISESPKQSGLFPFALEVLYYLKSKGYKLYLLTNGFKEVQLLKIANSKLDTYFDLMVTSDDIGYAKPDKRIFEYALKTVNAKKSESLMIGDDLVADIGGAKSFGIDTVYFNVEGKKHSAEPTYEINSLKELMTLL